MWDRRHSGVLKKALVPPNLLVLRRRCTVSVSEGDIAGSLREGVVPVLGTEWAVSC